MQVISLIAQKGGVGKTTLATCLAVQAVEQNKQVLVIDLDPQATASFWSDTRGKPDDPAVMSIQPVRLPAVLVQSDAGTDMVIIDGAAVSKEVAYSAAEVSDLVPFKAAVFDINSVAQTVQTIKQVDRATLCQLRAARARRRTKPRTSRLSLGLISAPCLLAIVRLSSGRKAQAWLCRSLKQTAKPPRRLKHSTIM